MSVAAPLLDEAVTVARAKLSELRAERRVLLAQKASMELREPGERMPTRQDVLSVQNKLERLVMHEAGIRRALRAAGVSVDA